MRKLTEVELHNIMLCRGVDEGIHQMVNWEKETLCGIGVVKMNELDGSYCCECEAILFPYEKDESIVEKE
jgi:hypothetical protein